MNYCLVLAFVFQFFGFIHQDLWDMTLDRSDLQDMDSLTVDQRNDYIKQRLFANPADSSLLEMALENLELSHYLAYKKGVMMAYERLGLIYQYSLSNPFKALDNYLQALTLAEQSAWLDQYKWGVKGNIATIYYEQEEYEKALGLFREVASNSPASELTAILNIGNIFGAQQKNDSAIFYFKKALTFDQIKNNPVQQANLYSNLSLIYVQAGQAEPAIDFASRSLALVDSLGIEFVRPTAYANAAMAYLEQGKVDKAETLALESLRSSREQGNLFAQKSALGTLSDIYSAKGDYKKGLETFREFSELKDSLNNQNRRVEVNRKQMAFDFEQERSRSNAEIQRQMLVRKYTLGLAILFVLFLLTGVYFYIRRKDALAEKQDAEFRALVSETELKALQSQMNPHFIFNSLNSIGDYILKNDADAAQDYLSKFSKLMRMVLENSGQKEIALDEDLKFLEMYLQIESKRQPGKFSYTIQVPATMDTANILVPPMLLQPFIENCIWHAFAENLQSGEIKISFWAGDETLHCRVEDNGMGRNPEYYPNGRKSMGVGITESRIQILNQRVGRKGKLHIIDKPGNSGTTVEITLPLLLAY